MDASKILGFDDRKTKVVKVKQWNCELTILELGLQQGLSLFSHVKDGDDSVSLTAEQIAEIVAWGVVDPTTNERIFSDDDVPALMQKSREALVFLYTEITKLSTDGAAEKN